MNKKSILERFSQNEYKQIICDKCMETFLTNVYEYDDEHVLLEKRGLGLEYFCHALHEFHLTHIPAIDRIGVLNEDDEIIDLPFGEELFQTDETDYRYIYIMEKLLHLEKEDEEFFNGSTQNLELQSIENKTKVFENINEKYGKTLAEDISDLCRYYREHEDYIAWDLHADNLMRRPKTGEIVILDPYAVKV